MNGAKLYASSGNPSALAAMGTRRVAGMLAFPSPRPSPSERARVRGCGNCMDMAEN